jgi:hypothetical protein
MTHVAQYLKPYRRRHPLWVNDVSRGDQCSAVPQVNTNLQDITTKTFTAINSVVRHALQEVT